MTTTQLRDGTTTSDPRLDRLEWFDPRSRQYAVRDLLPRSMPSRGRSWPCVPRLDQGREGACVGFAWAHDLAAQPVVVKGADDALARDVYRAAQFIDPWPGEAYEGTSVLAGAQVLQQRGLLGEYRWAFGIEDVLATLATLGPVVLGVPWLSSMFRPEGPASRRGDVRVVDVHGSVAGGHAVLARGVIMRPRSLGIRLDDPLVRLRQSWGDPFDWAIRAADLETLLHQGGEACVPTIRLKAA